MSADKDGHGMRVSPDVVAAGQIVAVHFAPGTIRGLMFCLSRPSVGDGWELLYLLVSDANGDGGGPSWWSWEEGRDVFVPAVGISSPSPDHLVIPSDAEDGPYLLSTWGPSPHGLTITVAS